MAVIKRFWGHLMLEVMWLLLVAGAGLVFVDWLIPATRLRGVGLLAFCAGGVIFLRLTIEACVGKSWAAGGRAERRRAALEEQVPAQLAAVRELAPRR